MTDPKRLPLMLLVSLILHALLAIAYVEWTRRQGWDLRLPPSALQTRLISPRDFARLEQRESVRTSPGRVVKNPPDRAKYVSERTQRVEKQSYAPGLKFGQAGGHAGASTSAARESAAAQADERSERLRKLGLGAPLPEPSPNENAATGDSGDGRVTYGQESLRDKDIAVGTRTLINTDEYVFASFFNRVRDDVAARWEPRVSAALQQRQRAVPRGTYLTQTRFWFNEAGQVLRIEIEKSSGVAAFDEAAREALRELPQIRNPPRALRRADGTYEMQFGFIVYYGESGFRADYVPDPRL